MLLFPIDLDYNIREREVKNFEFSNDYNFLVYFVNF